MLNHPPLDHSWIARHIPHQGSMCLLDAVTGWDTQHVRCRAQSHRAADNPLRAHDRLGAACGIEYAAQAMAVHAALLVPADHLSARFGYLASIRGTQLLVSRLDDIAADLAIEARCIAHSDNTILYQFSLHADSRLLLTGRATVILDAAAHTPLAGDRA